MLITGAAGQIGYALCPMVARGIMLGADTPVVLHLLDIEPAAQALEGVKMELLDAAFPLLQGVCCCQGAGLGSARVRASRSSSKWWSLNSAADVYGRTGGGTCTVSHTLPAWS